jgi:hypothetical protein
MPEMAIYLRAAEPDLLKSVTDSHIAPEDTQGERKIASSSMTVKAGILFGGFPEVCRAEIENKFPS